MTTSAPDTAPAVAATERAYFVHEKALLESTKIGPRTRVWAFAHVLPGATIGADCNVCDGVFIENDVVVGDRVTIKCGVQLWDGVTLEDDVFVGPNATFTNDRYPRSRATGWQQERTVVRARASIGANATILPGLTVGEGAMVGAGAVVTRDVPPGMLVVGNPARVTGPARNTKGTDRPAAGIVELPVFTDERGSLTFGQRGSHMPFTPRRYYAIMGVPEGAVRGQHAHRRQHGFITCLTGAFTIMLDDGTRQRTWRLDTPKRGLYIPPLHWNTLSEFTADAVVLCLASEAYDPLEYLHDYDEFLAAVKEHG